MKKFKIAATVLGMVAMLGLAACKSTPQEEPAAEEPAAEEPVQIEEPQEEPEPEPQPEPEPEPEPAADYSEANRALLEKVEASRKAAKEAGAENANSAAFKAAEAEYAAEKAAVAAGSSEDLSKALGNLDSRYQALAAYANAKAKKDRIDSLGFASYDQSSYNVGSKALEELSSPVALVAPGADWNKKAISAEENFDKVLDSAFRALSREERINAFNAKKNADSVKAAVSRKDEYNKGVEFFSKGDSQYSTKNPEGALSSYTSAKETFTRLYSEISEARAKAQAAIDAARARVSQSAEVAEEADQRSPLGEGQIEGIEDEDAQLLEEDDFTATETAATELQDAVEETVQEDAEK